MPIQKVEAYFRDYHVKETDNAAQRGRGQERPVDDEGEEGEDEDSIEEEEEDSMDGFLELEDEMAVDAGAPYPKPIPVPSRERTMMRKQKGKEDRAIKVKGKFIMDGPWWIASFESVKEGDTFVSQGSPTYALRNLSNENGRHLLQLLLRRAFDPKTLSPGSAEDQLRQSFWDYFEKHRSIRKPKTYTFNQFFKALEAAFKEEEETASDQELPIAQAAKMIMHQFDPLYGGSSCQTRQDQDEERKKKREFDLRFVYRCYKFPLLFKVLPLLFEREALSILSTADMKNLETLDTVLRESPEDFGFYTSMRKHKWGTIEASFQGFVKAGLIPANLFKCTAKQKASAPRPSASKSKTKKDQPSTSNQPSTSTAKSGKVASKASKSNGIKILSVRMARVLKLYDIVKQGCNRGKHTYLYEEAQVKKEWRKAAIKDYPCGSERLDAYKELNDRDVVEMEKEKNEPVKVHWTKYRRYEESIASSIEQLFSEHKEDPWILPLGGIEDGNLDENLQKLYNFDEFQLGAAKAIREQPVTVILGRGGCGKTHVVSSVIKEYQAYLEEERLAFSAEASFLQEAKNREENQDGECSKDAEVKKNDEKKDETKNEDDDEKKKKEKKEEEKDPIVLLTAPTGRAASILKRRIGMKAKTLHSVLGSIRRCDPEYFPYRKVEILVVDECSMMPISVLSEVLRTLLRYSLKKVVFLGDPYQLPSIDPGNFFQDIIKVFNETHIDSVQTLKINHRTDEGGRLITENARRIAEHKSSDLVWQRDRFELIDPSTMLNGAGRNGIIDRLIRSREQLKNHKNSQLVAFRNIDVRDMNKVCCHFYAQHFPFKGKKHNFRIKDKICARKNSFVRILKRITPEGSVEEVAGGSREDNTRPRDEEAGPSNKEKKKKKKKEDELRVSNGDTFFIKNWREEVDNRGKKRQIVTLKSMDEEEGYYYEVDFNEMIRSSKVQFAWARTINTYQGSETECIVYIVSPHSNYENRQHLYTAITRARKGCYVICSPARLRQVIARDPDERQTSLARFLRENFGLPQGTNCNLPRQLAASTPSCSTNRQSTPGTPASSANPMTYLQGHSAIGTQGRSTKSMTYPPRQSVPGTPGSSANLGTLPSRQQVTSTPCSSMNSGTFHSGQSATGTPGSSANLGTHHLAQPATGRPDQLAPSNVSSSSKAVACSPCKWDRRQELLARDALVHRPSASNQATQLHNLHHDIPGVRRELDYKRSTLGESSAGGDPGFESVAVDSHAAKPNKGRLSRKRKAQSNNVPVKPDQGADDAPVQKTEQSPKVLKLNSSENALLQKTEQSPKGQKQHSSVNPLVQTDAHITSAGFELIAEDAPAANPYRSSLSRRKRKANNDSVPVNHGEGPDVLVQKTAQSHKVLNQQVTEGTLLQKTTRGPGVSRQQSSKNVLVKKTGVVANGTNEWNETPIVVNGLYRRRYHHLHRLLSQESEPSTPESDEDKENSNFPDSCNTEPSQFLLRPPSAPLVLSLLKSSEESQRSRDDEDVFSSDESGFSSSGSSPLVRPDDDPTEAKDDGADDDFTGYDDVFGDDDEDWEMSQSILQPHRVF